MNISKKFFGLAIVSSLALTACVTDDDYDSLEDNFRGEASSSSVKSSSSSAKSSSSSVKSSSSSVRSSSSEESSSSSVNSSSSAKSSSSSEEMSSSSSSVSSSSSSARSSSSSVTSSSSANGIDFSALSFPACKSMVMWSGQEGLEQIETGCDNGSETSGHWFAENDSEFGGASKIEWPVEPGNGYVGGENSLEPVIRNCGGVCGTFSLDKGDMGRDPDPFVKVGFNIAGEKDDSGSADHADASSWGGICIGYESDINATLEMGFGDEYNEMLGGDVPHVSLPRSLGVKVKAIKWDDFLQAGWGPESGYKEMSGAQGAKMLSTLYFKLQAVSGSTGNFNVVMIGPYRSCQ